jgi:hypothetical protein
VYRNFVQSASGENTGIESFFQLPCGPPRVHRTLELSKSFIIIGLRARFGEAANLTLDR